ncbi:MAG: endonuclease/exonuclease/phosphatase family protein [Alistipes sp.]
MAVVLGRWVATINPIENPQWVITALAVPVFLVLNFLMMAWWLVRRRWLLALLPLVALLVGSPFMLAMMQVCAAQSVTSCDLKVATFNVHGFRDENGLRSAVNKLSALVQEQKVDVLCLNEFRTTRDYDTAAVVAMFGMPYVTHKGAIMVLSRYPITAAASILFPERESNFTNGALQVDVAVAGRSVRIIACHLQTTGVASVERSYSQSSWSILSEQLLEALRQNTRLRAVQVALLRQVIENSSLPVIVAGDLNDTPSTYTYSVLSDLLTDTFIEAGHGWGGTFRGAYGVLRLDYIFADKTLACTRCDLLELNISDHKPVVAALNFK